MIGVVLVEPLVRDETLSVRAGYEGEGEGEGEDESEDEIEGAGEDGEGMGATDAR